MDHHDSLVNFTTQIVSAHVANNPVPLDQLPNLIQKVHETLGAVLRKQGVIEKGGTPAVPISKSTRPDVVFCLDCGKPFKMLKRHLMTDHQLTPDAYRQKWGLPQLCHGLRRLCENPVLVGKADRPGDQAA